MNSANDPNDPSLADLDLRLRMLEQRQDQDMENIPKLQHQIDLLQEQIDNLVELLERTLGQEDDRD